MENRDIIVVGIQSWDIKIGSNCKNIALEFAKKNRVLYVNSPISRMTALKEKSIIKQYQGDKKVNIKNVSKNLWSFYPQKIIESISSLSINFLFDALNKHNNRLFASEIKKAIKVLGFKDYIIFCDSDMFRSYYLKELLQPDIFIYYTRDNLLGIKFWQTQGRRLEPLLMAKSDLVMANSEYLRDKAAQYNNRSYFVGQGCDLSVFTNKSAENPPEDITQIPKPIIGYIGTLVTLRLDIEIIRHIATQKPEWNIVLVGPEDEGFSSSGIHKIKNIHFLGSKKETELPSYLSAFTVAMNPQLVNEVTIGNYPRKIDEYLAMGKPTVATETQAMQYFREYVSLAKGKEGWTEAIENELQNNSTSKEAARIRFAMNHTWENNINEIYHCIEEYVKKREKSANKILLHSQTYKSMTV
jgi:glycosyltransferase involved in cell wall biosynthesis